MRRSTWIFGGLALSALVIAAIVSPSGGGLTGVPGGGGGTVVKPVPVPAAGSVTAGAVHMSAALDAGSVLYKGPGNAWLAVSLVSDAVKGTSRPPLNVAVVIDASGSMDGEPLANAKLAAREVIGRLGPRDRATLVAYGSYARVLVPSTVIDEVTRGRLYAAIEAIGDMGGTNIDEGLRFARDQLVETGSSELVNRIVLLSDGQANAGDATSPPALGAVARSAAERGISVTAMGLGLDYDEDVMMAIAEHGGGNYYFIESPGALVAIFKKELDAVGALVAKSTVLEITPAPGVVIREVFGYAEERDGATVLVRPGDLYGSSERKIMLRLDVPADSLGELPVASVRLRLRDALADGAERMAETGVVAAVVADASAVEASRNADVSAKVMEVETSKTMAEATAAFEVGDTDKAVTILRARKAHVAAAVVGGELDEEDAREGLGALDSLIGIGASPSAKEPETKKKFSKAGKASGRTMAW